MERNAGYEIKRLLLYDDNTGFALGENLRAPDPYVTWKVTEEQGRRSFDWGHYFTTERAAVKDFLKRAADYEKDNSVSLVSEGPQPDSFKSSFILGISQPLMKPWIRSTNALS